MAEGRYEPLSSSKGHARGTTRSVDVPDEHVSEPSVAATEHAIPKHPVRRAEKTQISCSAHKLCAAAPTRVD
jgi:hypothetical protein